MLRSGFTVAGSRILDSALDFGGERLVKRRERADVGVVEGLTSV